MKVNFKRFFPKAIAASLATPDSACFVLYSVEDVLIPPRSCHCINTHIDLSIPKSYFGKIHARSSWAKRFTSISGWVIDSDFKGKIAVVFQNRSNV